MKEVLETLQALYRDSPSPALAADREMNILWANPAALVSRYPVLSLPGGLSLLFSEAQLSEVSSAEGATPLSWPESPGLASASLRWKGRAIL